MPTWNGSSRFPQWIPFRSEDGRWQDFSPNYTLSQTSYTPTKLAEIGSSILALAAAVFAFEAVLHSIRVHIDKRILPPVLDQVQKVIGREIFVRECVGLRLIGLAFEDCTIGPALDGSELSSLDVAKLEVWIAPLASLRRKRIVLNAEIVRPNICVKQGQGFRWFGQEQPEEPSPDSRAGQAKKRRLAHKQLILEGKSVFHNEDNLVSGPWDEANEREDGDGTDDEGVHRLKPDLDSISEPSIDSSAQTETSWKESFAKFESPIDVDHLQIRDGTLFVDIYDDPTTRVVRNLQGQSILSRNFAEIKLIVGGDADTRWPIKFPCREAYVANPMARISTFPLEEYHSPEDSEKEEGGRIDFEGSLSLPSLDFFGTVRGRELHAPLLENIFDLPVKMEEGRVNGEFKINFPHTLNFPEFYSELHCRSAQFCFPNAPSRFCGCDLQLIFDKDRMYLHKATGKYGNIPLYAGGDVYLDPENGEYHITAQTTGRGVDANKLIRTLGGQALPYSLAGRLQGNIQCTGPLEFPVFSGIASAINSTREEIHRENVDQDGNKDGPLQPAGLAILEEGINAAVIAYDRIPFASASAIFVCDTTTDTFRCYGIDLQPVGGGQIIGSGRAWTAKGQAETDPNAMAFKLKGMSLPLDGVIKRYGGALQESLPSVKVGRADADISISGALLAPEIWVSWVSNQKEGPLAEFQGSIHINRRACKLDCKAATLKLSSELDTHYLPLDPNRRLRTAAEARKASRPVIDGGLVDLTLKGLDVLELSREIDEPPALFFAYEPALRLKLSGNAKFIVKAIPVDSTRDAPSSEENKDDVNVNVESDGSSSLQQSLFFKGHFSLANFKVNQLNLVRQLSGSLRLSPSEVRLEGRARPDESLLLKTTFGKAASLPLADLPGVVQADQSTAATLSLRRGHLAIESFAGPHTAHLRVKSLKLDEIECASLRGHLTEAEVELDFVRKKGNGYIRVENPRFSGVQGTSFTSAFKWVDGKLVLQPTVLTQSASKYELEGEYVMSKTAEAKSGLSNSRDENAESLVESEDEYRDSDGMLDEVDSAATLVDGSAASATAGGGSWRLELRVPSAEITEALPAAQLILRSAKPALAAKRSKSIFLESVRSLELAADALREQLELQTEKLLLPDTETVVVGGNSVEERLEESLRSKRKKAKKSSKSFANSAQDTSTLPKKTARVRLQDLRGKWNGTFRASGKSEYIDVDIDLVGHDWHWGPNTLQALVVKGSYNSRDGVALQRVQLDADGASFRASGRLLCAKQQAEFALLEFPAPLVNAWEITTVPLQGSLYVNGKIGGSSEQPEVDLTLELLDGAVADTQLAGAIFKATLNSERQLSVNAEVHPSAGPGHFRLSSAANLDAITANFLDEEKEKRNDASRTKSDIHKLIVVNAFIKDSGMMLFNALTDSFLWKQGSADVTVTMQGPISNPAVRGKAIFNRGVVEVPGILNRQLQGLTGVMVLEDDTLRVELLEGRQSRKGFVRVVGSLPVKSSLLPSTSSVMEIIINGMEVKIRNVYNGVVDGELRIRGSLAQPSIGGRVALKNGAAYLSGADTRQDATAESFAKTIDLRTPVTASKVVQDVVALTRASPLGRVRVKNNFFKGSEPVNAKNQAHRPGDFTIDCKNLVVLLGPELRMIYPFVMNFKIQGYIEVEGPAAPSLLKAAGEIQLLSGEVNLLATQLRLNREHANVVIFDNDNVLDPDIDISLVGADLKANVKGKASAWAENVVLTYSGSKEGRDSLSQSEAARIFEGQMAESLLEKDGRLALSHLASSAVYNLLPKFEVAGESGPDIRWRFIAASVPHYVTASLTGAPTKDSGADLLPLSLAEFELKYGSLSFTVERKPIKDVGLSTTWSLLCQLTRNLRMIVGRSTFYEPKLIFEFSQ